MLAQSPTIGECGNVPLATATDHSAGPILEWVYAYPGQTDQMRFTPTLGLYCIVVAEHRISLALNVSPGVGGNLLGTVQVRDHSSQEILAEPRDVRKFRIHIGFGVLPCCFQHLLLAPPEPLGYLAQKDEQQHHEDP